MVPLLMPNAQALGDYARSHPSWENRICNGVTNDTSHRSPASRENINAYGLFFIFEREPPCARHLGKSPNNGMQQTRRTESPLPYFIRIKIPIVRRRKYMPWLPFYASKEDFDTLREHVNATDDLAYLVTCGPGQWQAVRSLESIECGRYCLWHVPSGPLPLLRPGSEAPGEVADPFAGWSELRPGADSSTPYFGAGHPGVFWLNLRASGTSRHGEPIVGLSSFEWIGNHYRIIGNAAMPQTEASWKMLRRWVTKSASKVPRGGPTGTTPPEIWAFPGAEALFSQGAKGGNV